MMMKYKDYIAQALVGRRVRFRCDCLLRLDITGEVTGYEVRNGEIVYRVYVHEKNRTVEVGENTGGLDIEFL